MKFKTSLALGLSAFGFASVLRAETAAPAAAPAVPAPAAAVSAPEVKYGEAEVLQAIGWLAGRQVNLDSFGFSEEQMNQVVAGIRQAAADKEMPFPREKIGPLIQEFVQRKQAEFLARLKTQNEAEGVAYFAKLATDKNVTVLPSGLAFETLKAGTGAKPKIGDTVKVNYTGKLVNGTVFDSNEGKDPIEFPIDQVIPGWTEGIQQVAVGGKIRLHIPAKLGYGDTGAGRIPPGAALVFEVELLDTKPTPAPAAPAAPEAAPAAPAAPATPAVK